VKTQFGLHIIKAIDKKTENGVEKVNAAHILLKFEPSYNTTDAAQRNSEMFAETAKEDGFNISADKLGVEIKQTTEFPDNKIGQIPGLGKMESALMWAFNSEKEAISDVYYMPQGYYIFQVADIKPAGYRPFDEVKEICKNRIKLEKLKELAKAYAEKIKPQVEQNGNFQQIVDMDTANVISADTTAYFPKNVFVPKIGRAPAVAAAAFSLPLNQTSGMLETDRGYYFIRVTGRTEFNEEDYAKQRETIRNRILQQKARTIYTQWFEKLKEQANIKDYRYRFFRS
jgi:parvulin-like peptidyl-prolyl isomerase